MRPALALLALVIPATCFVAPQRRLAARPLFAEENADFDPNAKVSQLDEARRGATHAFSLATGDCDGRAAAASARLRRPTQRRS
jgi:hypothetical protein